MEKINKKILVIVTVIAILVGFGGGILFSASKEAKPIKQLINREEHYQNIDFSLFWDVWDKLNQRYVDKNKLDVEKMLNGAIEGMVNSLGDPYTVFFEPSDSKKFQEEISGTFGGVGMEIGKRNNILTVIAPIKDTPAYKAGIQSGDKILKIDSKVTSDLSVEEAVNLIRGRQGTKVTLTIAKKDTNATRDVILTRENIKVPTAQLTFINSPNKKIAYLQLFSFNQNVDSEFKKAAQEIIKENPAGLILDLRNNPGGLLDSAVSMSGWFLDKDKVVTIEEFGNGSRNEFHSDGNSLLKPFPTVILINGGSASASEIVAGALHDNRAIKLVGEKTFGKGSVQELDKFSNGSSLKVTIAKWLTPDGISISDKGIDPDVKVEVLSQDIESGKFELGAQGKDPQLDRAIDILR